MRTCSACAVAVKASGNALGKGVVVCSTLEEAEDAINQMLVDRAFGDAGAEVVVEDRLEGPEFSLLTIVGDGGFVSRDLGIPAIVLGPGGLNDQAHRPDESVSIHELVTAAKAYALLALRLL